MFSFADFLLGTLPAVPGPSITERDKHAARNHTQPKLQSGRQRGMRSTSNLCQRPPCFSNSATNFLRCAFFWSNSIYTYKYVHQPVQIQFDLKASSLNGLHNKCCKFRLFPSFSFLCKLLPCPNFVFAHISKKNPKIIDNYQPCSHVHPFHCLPRSLPPSFPPSLPLSPSPSSLHAITLSSSTFFPW